MKDELGRKIMKDLAALRAKIYIHLTDNNYEDKSYKGTKKYAIKRKLKTEDHKNYFLEGTQLKNEINQLEKNSRKI